MNTIDWIEWKRNVVQCSAIVYSYTQTGWMRRRVPVHCTIIGHYTHEEEIINSTTCLVSTVFSLHENKKIIEEVFSHTIYRNKKKFISFALIIFRYTRNESSTRFIAGSKYNTRRDRRLFWLSGVSTSTCLQSWMASQRKYKTFAISLVSDISLGFLCHFLAKTIRWIMIAISRPSQSTVDIHVIFSNFIYLLDMVDATTALFASCQCVKSASNRVIASMSFNRFFCHFNVHTTLRRP